MRILTYVGKIYEPEKQLLTNDRSGLSLYVHDIVKYLSEKSECYVITGQPNPGATIGNIHYLQHKKSNLLRWNSICDILDSVKTFFSSNGSLTNRLKSAYYRLDVATLRHAIQTVKPDIVNIHGCNLQVLRQIEVCQKENTPFVVSLHGLIGIDPTVKGTPKQKAMEGVLLHKADENQWSIVAISSGVKNRAVDFYGLKQPDNITVILNGTEILENPPCKSVELCESLIRSGKKIITCVGGLSKRKNQTQLVDAWSQSPKDIRKGYAVLFFGNDLTNGKITRQIESLGLQNELFVYGFAQKEEVNYTYEHACLNILASIDEGFGLSIVEAMTHGVPSVIFNDIDAANDLYDKCSMVLVPDRTTATFAKAIKDALNKEWNKSAIMNHSLRFSMEKVCEEYLDLYHNVISNHHKSWNH